MADPGNGLDDGLPPPLPGPPYTHTFTVALHDTDAAGILFFAHLFRHAHDGYEAFMARVGFPLHRILREGQWLLPLVHAEADYRLPLAHGEAVTVRLGVAKLGRTSFSIAYRFLDRANRVRATATTVHVHLTRGDISASPLPPALAAALEGWRWDGPEPAA